MKPLSEELPEFVWVKSGSRRAYVHRNFEPSLSDALLDGRGVVPANLGGRGEILRLESAQGNILIRRYHRGGAIAGLMGDRYLLRNRPIAELTVHVFAWSNRVPTVMPVGAMTERRGLVVRGAFATLEVAAQDLLQYLRDHDIPDPGLLDACGRAIRAMHAASIYHADLQVKNLLVGEGRAYVIDFDRAKVKHVTRAMALRNLARLRRSFIKCGLPIAAYERISSAYNSAETQPSGLLGVPP